MSVVHSLVSFGSRVTRGGAVSAVALVPLLVVLVGCEAGTGSGAKEPGAKHPLIGNPAPAFDLPAQSGGKRASLDKAQGKVLLVDFWATWCGPCRASFPKYEALAKKFEDDVVVVGISEDDEADGIADFAK